MLYLSNLEKNFFRIAGALKLHFFGFSVLTNVTNEDARSSLRLDMVKSWTLKWFGQISSLRETQLNRDFDSCSHNVFFVSKNNLYRVLASLQLEPFYDC